MHLLLKRGLTPPGPRRGGISSPKAPRMRLGRSPLKIATCSFSPCLLLIILALGAFTLVDRLLLARRVMQAPLTSALQQQRVELDTPGPRFTLTILVHTSAPMWDTRARAIKDTWLSEELPAGVRLLWVSTEPLATSEPYILVSNEVRPGLAPEPLGAMNERVVQSMAKIMMPPQPPSDFYMKVDDDTYVNVSRMLQAVEGLESPTTKAHFLGCECAFKWAFKYCVEQELAEYLNNCTAGMPADGDVDGMPTYACGGAGYILSEKAIRDFNKYELTVGAPRMYEDMMVGWVMSVHFKVPVKNPLQTPFWEEGPFTRNIPNGTECLEMGTYHKALPPLMHKLYECATVGRVKASATR